LHGTAGSYLEAQSCISDPCRRARHQAKFHAAVLCAPRPPTAPTSLRHRRPLQGCIAPARVKPITSNGSHNATLCGSKPHLAGPAGWPPRLHHPAPVTDRQPRALDAAPGAVANCPAPEHSPAEQPARQAAGQEGRLPRPALDMAPDLGVCHRRSGLGWLRHLRGPQPRRPAAAGPQEEDARRPRYAHQKKKRALTRQLL
jgi:hypothetical protein